MQGSKTDDDNDVDWLSVPLNLYDDTKLDPRVVAVMDGAEQAAQGDSR